MIDTSSDKMNLSINASNNNSDFTVSFLKDQLKFMTDKIKTATAELEDKERVI